MNMTCKQCVLDHTANIRLNEQGLCNYCIEYEIKKKSILKNKSELNKIINKLKATNNKPNCIVGISGGLDSSFLLYKALELGLHPIAVHVDTGWNTANSAQNIETLTNQLNVPLHTYVLDWKQFSQLQLAYIKAGVIDLEFPTDHYYLAALYHVANQLNITYILTGNNFTSEGIMPEHWNHNKGDTQNMLDIFKTHTTNASLNQLPTLTLLKRFYFYNIKRIENIFLLDYLNYNKTEAKKLLQEKFNWKEHPSKHGESIFTRFYHRYILPTRFGIDIRRAHLSSLICSGQLTRSEALGLLNSEQYSPDLMIEDKSYVLKKLGLNQEEFDSYMTAPIINHSHFKSEVTIKKTYNQLAKGYLFRGILKISNRT